MVEIGHIGLIGLICGWINNSISKFIYSISFSCFYHVLAAKIRTKQLLKHHNICYKCIGFVCEFLHEALSMNKT